MKPLFPLLMLISIVSTAQDKIVISTHRILPQPDKIAALEKSLAAYTRVYQKGEWRWRVYEILSGPNAGWLHIEEGPISWEQMDDDGYLNAKAVMRFGETVISLSERTGAGCAMYRGELSSSALSENASDLSIEHMFYKPGTVLLMEELIGKQKKVWEETGQQVAVFQNATSGTEHFILVTRHKEGWKEKAKFNEKSFAEAYNKLYGSSAYSDHLKLMSRNVNEIWSEMVKLRADLSSE